MEYSLKCIWPQKPFWKSTSQLWWKADSTLRNTSLTAAKSSHLEEIPISFTLDESSGSVSCVPFCLGPWEAKLESTQVRDGSPTPGEGAILCINLGTPGDSVRKTS